MYVKLDKTRQNNLQTFRVELIQVHKVFLISKDFYK